MKIARPPRTSRPEFNLTKQAMVFDLVYDGRFDIWLDYVAHCDTLGLTHDPAYVRLVRNGKATNGFGDTDHRVLWHAEQSCQALKAAAEAAWEGHGDGVKCAFAPVSGFHHAGYAAGGGYCTFNGLVDTAETMFVKHNARTLILDGDGHYGDGTEQLLDQLKLRGRLKQWWIGRDASTAWHEKLKKALEKVNLVLYQAGADSHKDDPYGSGSLTTGEFMYRDRLVFRVCKEAGVPIVWTLAGGYGPELTLNLHTATFEAAVETFYPGQLVQRRPIKRAAEVLVHPDDGPGAA